MQYIKLPSYNLKVANTRNHNDLSLIRYCIGKGLPNVNLSTLISNKIKGFIANDYLELKETIM